MFNSPLHYCEAVRTYAALDQTRAECAREQRCSLPAERCSLRAWFTDAGAARPGTDRGTRLTYRRTSLPFDNR
jgi:hypothetical protein